MEKNIESKPVWCNAYLSLETVWNYNQRTD